MQLYFVLVMYLNETEYFFQENLHFYLLHVGRVS